MVCQRTDTAAAAAEAMVWKPGGASNTDRSRLVSSSLFCCSLNIPPQTQFLWEGGYGMREHTGKTPAAKLKVINRRL